MVVGRPYAAANLVQSPDLSPGTAALTATGVAPIIPSLSVALTVPVGSIHFTGHAAVLAGRYLRPGLMVIGAPRVASVALSDTAAVTVDDIDSSTRTQYLRPSATIHGTNFEAAQNSGTVEIGGVSQTVTGWSNTAITIGPVERGTLEYGDYNLTVTNDSGRSSSLLITLEPESGWFYVNLDMSNADVNALIPTNPALDASTNYAGWQISYGNFLPSGPGYATVYSDATFAYGNGLASFSAEINNGTGWGATGTQSFNVAATPDVVALALTGRIPTMVVTTNTFLEIPTGVMGLVGIIPSQLETTTRNLTVPTGSLRIRAAKPQGRSMYGLGSGGLGTGGLAGRNRDELTGGTGVSKNVQ
jgi:hypothetical protein